MIDEKIISDYVFKLLDDLKSLIVFKTQLGTSQYRLRYFNYEIRSTTLRPCSLEYARLYFALENLNNQTD